MQLFPKKYFSFGLVLLIYTLISVVIFWPRWQNITTHYGAADFDTDGTLWYYWARIHTERQQINFNFTNELIGFPYGYNLSYIPYFSFIYELNLLAMKALGGSWQSIILVSNLSTILSYPLAAFTAFLLTFYLTKRTYPSFISGLIFSYSYYHVLMVRGSLSQNHLEFIPLFYLSFLFFLDRPSVKSLLLSGLAFAVLFMSNAYWAFFSMVFTPIFFVFYRKQTLRQRIKLAICYYPTVLLLTASLNLTFIQQQLYNLNPYQLLHVYAKVGGVKDQLISTLSFFSPSSNALFRPWEYLGGDHYLGYAVVLIALSGMFIRRKHKLFGLFLVAFLLAILLSSKVSPFLAINEVYFQYFRAFRAVSRLVIFASLFLGILVAFSLDKLTDRLIGKLAPQIRTMVTAVLAVCLPLLIVLEGIPGSSLKPQMTNFERIESLYQPIKDNPQIRRIAAYPMKVDGSDAGFPMNYQIIGQMIHQKTLVGGKDRFITQSNGFETQIENLAHPESINTLTSAGIDTVLIYHNMYSQSSDDIARLKNDPRIVYLGTYQQPMDENSDISNNDRSRHYSLFQIRAVLERNAVGDNKVELTSSLPPEKLSVTQLSATEYSILLNTVSEPFELYFSEPFSADWQLFLANDSSQPLFLAEHQKHQDCCNRWAIDLKNYPDVVELRLRFIPVQSMQLSNAVRWAVLAGISLFYVSQLIISVHRRKGMP